MQTMFSRTTLMDGPACLHATTPRHLHGRAV